MNANRIINMIVRHIMRRVVTRGIGAGLDMAGRSRDADRAAGSRGGNDAKDGATSQKLDTRQAQRITRQMRRFMRF